VWRGGWNEDGTRSTDTITFCSVNGQKLGDYAVTQNYGIGVTPAFYATQISLNYYFGKRLISNANGWVYSDRLRSIGKFYPYGQEISTTTNGTEKFTGYFRDTETGNDYAINRYEVPSSGRFITPDPSGLRAVNPANPQSWNMYAYAQGDPVNNRDPRGLNVVAGGDPGDCDPDDFECVDPSGGYGGGINVCVSVSSLTEQPDPWCTGGGPVGPSTFGSSGPQITVGGYSNTNSQAQQVQQDLLKLLGAIANNPTCSGWLASAGININTRLENPDGTLITSGIGVGTFSTGAAAVYGTKGTNLQTGAVITVNTLGAFFNRGVGMPPGVPNIIASGTSQAQALILIHELGHLANVLQPNDADGGQKQNNMDVWKYCNKTIMTIQF